MMLDYDKPLLYPLKWDFDELRQHTRARSHQRGQGANAKLRQHSTDGRHIRARDFLRLLHTSGQRQDLSTSVSVI
jgi:hypothetical protein